MGVFTTTSVTAAGLLKGFSCWLKVPCWEGWDFSSLLLAAEEAFVGDGFGEEAAAGFSSKEVDAFPICPEGMLETAVVCCANEGCFDWFEAFGAPEVEGFTVKEDFVEPPEAAETSETVMLREQFSSLKVFSVSVNIGWNISTAVSVHSGAPRWVAWTQAMLARERAKSVHIGEEGEEGPLKELPILNK
jgi:hypothetical protein